MILKNFMIRLKTAYINFYRPARIDVAIKRREILSCIYAASSLCFFISVMYSYSKWKDHPEIKEKLEPFDAGKTYGVKIGGDKWFEILHPDNEKKEGTPEK